MELNNNWKKWMSFILVCGMMLVLFAGCKKQQATGEGGENKPEQQGQISGNEENGSEKKDGGENEQQESGDKVLCIDADGNEVQITKKPKRTVVINSSMLDLWYMAGGTAVGRPESKNLTNVPPEAEGIEIVGHVAEPNIEKVLSLEPDLVILSATMEKHKGVKEILDQNGIESLTLGYENYEDFEATLDTFAKINDDQRVIGQVVPGIKQAVKEVIDRCPREKGPKTLVLFASARKVDCETNKAHVGKMVEILGGKNIVEDSPIEGQSRVQFSMERIIERDPDVILIATMGNMKDIEKRMEEEITSNQAWAGLRAVKEQRVHYLPNEFFLYKPNTQYPEAFEYLAKLMYPEELGK